MEQRTTRQAQASQERAKRTPLGTRNILTVQHRPGFHRVWVSDSPSLRTKLADYEAAGYTYVEENLQVGDTKANSGDKVSSRVTRQGGQGTMLYLMEVPEEYYKEDLEAQEAKIKEKEHQMFSPKSIEAGYGTAKTKRSSDWNVDI